MSRIPGHLPRRLAICYWGCDWITSGLPEEAYGDIEKALIETKERSFNCIRCEMGLNWMFDLEGKPRGPIKFTNWIPGASSNAHCVDGKGGARYDVLKRVIRLFELAKKHDMYIIGTSWEYQDSTTFVADKQIRDEVIGITEDKRLLHMARQWDRLLTELKTRRLTEQIAMVEVSNEVDCTGFPKGKHSKTLTEEAIAYLRERHSNILITADYGYLEKVIDQGIFASNTQVIDHHIYCGGLMVEVFDRAGIKHELDWKPDLENNEFLRWILRPNPMSWEEFSRRAGRVRFHWWPIMYLYDNLDNERYDYWCFRHYGQYVDSMLESIKRRMKLAGDFAAKMNLPLVVDEGYILYPPLGSRFEQSAAGRWIARSAVESAVANNHWGVIPTGYTRPNTLAWKDKYHCEKIKKINQYILES